VFDVEQLRLGPALDVRARVSGRIKGPQQWGSFLLLAIPNWVHWSVSYPAAQSNVWVREPPAGSSWLHCSA
jgi:hypothetical protein